MREYFEPHSEGLCPSFYAAYTITKIRDAIPYLHAAKDCTLNLRCHISVAMLGKPLYTPGTTFCEEDSIFGGLTKIEHALRDIITKREPKLLAVILGCGPLTINDNVEPLLEQLAYEYPHVKFISIKAGFNTKYEVEGAGEALKSLTKIMNNTVNRRENSFNLIGFTNFDGRKYFERTLKPLKINSTIVRNEGTNIDEIERALKAKINIPTHIFSELPLKEMYESFAVPYVNVLPYGEDPFKRVIQEVEETTGVKVRSKLNLWENKIKRFKEKLRGKRALIAASLGREINLACSCIALGLETVVYTCFLPNIADENIKYVRENGGEIYVERSVYETLMKGLDEDFDFIIGDWIFAPLALRKGAWFLSRISIATCDSPGYLGMLRLGEILTKRINSPARKWKTLAEKYRLFFDRIFGDNNWEGDGDEWRVLS